MSGRTLRANLSMVESGRCASCGCGFTLAEGVTRCHGCGALHHEQCWHQQGDGCVQCASSVAAATRNEEPVPLPLPEVPPPVGDTLPGPEQVIDRVEPPPTLSGRREAIRCASCGARCEADWDFCCACGAVLRAREGTEEAGDTKPCPSCRKPIRADAVKCRHCGWVLDTAIREARAATVPQGDAPGAGLALGLGIASLVICGIVTGPMAISNANKALALIRDNPGYTGKGKAIAGLVLGIIGTVLTVLGLIAKCAEM